MLILACSQDITVLRKSIVTKRTAVVQLTSLYCIRGDLSAPELGTGEPQPQAARSYSHALTTVIVLRTVSRLRIDVYGYDGTSGGPISGIKSRLLYHRKPPISGPRADAKRSVPRLRCTMIARCPAWRKLAVSYLSFCPGRPIVDKTRRHVTRSCRLVCHAISAVALSRRRCFRRRVTIYRSYI